MSCRNKAMDLLARREHSRVELERKLASRDFDEIEIADTLDQLQADNLLSDQRFVEDYVRGRIRRGFGPMKIRAELQARGVAQTDISDGLKPYAGQWLDRLAALQRRKFRRLPDDFAERGKQIRFLQSRGFDLGDIHAILNQDPSDDPNHDQYS